MKRGRTGRVKQRALGLAMALGIVGAAIAPAAPGPGGSALAEGGSGTIVHSADGVLLRAEPAFGAEVVATLAEGTSVGLRTDLADTVYDADGVTQWWPVATSDAEGWVAGFYLDIEGIRRCQCRCRGRRGGAGAVAGRFGCAARRQRAVIGHLGPGERGRPGRRAGWRELAAGSGFGQSRREGSLLPDPGRVARE